MTNLFPDTDGGTRPDGDAHEEQVGGGNYSLRRNIPISPNAPSVMAHLAKQRRLAVEAQDAQDAQMAVFSSGPPPGLHLAALGLKPVQFGNGEIFQPGEFFEGLDVSVLAADANVELTPEPERGPVYSTTSTSDPFTTASGAAARIEDIFTPAPAREVSTTPNPVTPPSPTTARPSARPHIFPSSPLTARPSKAAQANMGPVHVHVLDLMEFGPPGEMPGAPDAPTPSSASPGMDTHEDGSEAADEHTSASPTGRISQKDHDILKEDHERAYKIFLEIASQTGRTVDFVINNFNNTKGYGSGRNYWNLYQGYFVVNMVRERKRANLPNGTGMSCCLSTANIYLRVWSSSRMLGKLQDPSQVSRSSIHL